MHYKRPEKGDYKLSVLSLVDANRKDDHGQLCFLSGLRFGNLSSGSVVRIIPLSSWKSRRPVKSVASPETLSAGESIDEWKVIFKALNEVLKLNTGLWIADYSKGLFSTMHTCIIVTDRLIRGDINSIGLQFATKTISRMIWAPGNLNLADPRTKTETNLCQSLQILFATDQVPFDFTNAIVHSSDQFAV